ncbi:hypothetical protein F4678DRAFT_467095 [Xylaria arbuscula]|nr:hypothetical protein F4678DRAFT_467095 [Xylaria arbuscula]
MVKFVEADTTGLPLKRKQVAHACDKCRRRKKRCVHAVPNVHGDASSLGSPDKSAAAEKSPPSPSRRNSQAPVPTQHQAADNDMRPSPVSPAIQDTEKRDDTRPPAFFGDMNPEAILMEATSLCSRRDVSAPGGLGIWQAPPRPNAQSSGVPSVQSSSRRAVQDMVRSYLWNHCLPCRPPAPDYAVLKRIYFEKMNPIFPIFEDPAVSHKPDEVTEILLQQVISLAAAADAEASQHLRLSPNSNAPLMSRQEFCACLSNSVLATLDAGIVTDRVWLIRLSAALSLYTQPTNSEETDIPALLNSRAVHHAHTLGLQMAVDDAHPKKAMIQTIFCCIWALDRITGAFYGRARLMHQQDIGWNFDDCIRAQAPPFRLLLMTIKLLDQIIDLYCPGTRLSQPTLIELPIFEQMILDAEALKMTSSCLVSLEIFYHSIAILSTLSPADVASSALPNPAANSRRSLAADRITSLVSEEFSGQLSYMPFIPYAVSLSLSVSYRKMRHSKVPMFRNRGKRAFRKNILLLKSMDDMFWKSKTMVAMAEQVLNEMDKTVASLAHENRLTDHSKKAEPVSHGERPHAQPEETRPLDLAQQASEVGNERILFDAVPDLDLFGHFDPTFDLGAVDAALEGNLDLGMSANWFDWHQQWG